MAELVREIEKEDLPLVRELLGRAGRDKEYAKIERLGGMTNHSYKVTLPNGEELLVRIPGEGTEEMINRGDEKKSMELAVSLGIDSELLYFGEEGTKVMRFIPDPQEMNDEVMKRPEIIRQAAAIFRKLHTSGVDTGVRFEVFEMADLYEKIIREGGVALYPDYEQVKATVMGIKAAMDAEGEVRRVPCHNDCLVANWILDGSGKLYLVDWEYSGMNEAMWDLSCLSIEASYSGTEDELLLDAYFGRKPDTADWKKFIAARTYVDYLWTLWGLTRVPFDGDFMQEYADARYARLKESIKRYQTLSQGE